MNRSGRLAAAAATLLARRIAASVGLMIAALAAAGCGPPRPMPEAESPGARLYVARCGTTCHRPFHPDMLTPAMWDLMLQRMEPKLPQAGIAPLSAADRRAILDYLGAHARR